MKLNIQLFADGDIEIEVQLNTTPFDAQIKRVQNEMEEIEEKLALADMGFEVGDTDILADKYEKLGIKLDRLKQKKEEFNASKMNVGLAGITQELTQIEKNTTRTFKTIGRWALGIFSIRSAYMLIRQSVSQLSQENEDLANKINLIKGSLANLLAPVVEYIVNLVFRLLQYLNILTKTWFGIDLFKKTAKSGKSAVGRAQKLRKTLAGFDEMNILNDNTIASGGGGGGSTNWQPPEPGEIPSWLDWILTNGPKLIPILGGLGAGLLAFKLGAGGLNSLAIGTTFFFFLELIKDLTNTNLDGLTRSVKGLGDVIGIIGGVLMFFNPLLGVAVALVGLVIKYLPEISNWLDNIEDIIANGIIKCLERLKTEWKTTFGIIKQWFTEVWDAITGTWTKATTEYQNTINGLQADIIKVGEWLENFFDGVNTWINEKLDKLQKDVNDFIDRVKTGIRTGIIKAINKVIEAINKLIRGLNKIHFDTPDWLPLIGGKHFGFNIKEITPIPLAKGGVINMPGKGTPIAYGGERGREGVIPLTDSQQMELLGEAIGRYITINASITNTMNGRVISRELQKIQNENNFAGNR